jgi:hypothetical protein
MCPLCASTLAWIAFGGVSGGGIGTLLIKRRKGRNNGDDGNGTSDREP